MPPVELGCGGAERACLAMNTDRRGVMILTPGNEFTLSTDHDPLLSLNSMRDTCPRTT